MVTMFKSTRIFWFLFAYSGLSVRIFGLLFVEISSGAYSVFNCSHIPVLLRIFRFFWPKFFAYSGFTRIFRFPYSFFSHIPVLRLRIFVLVGSPVLIYFTFYTLPFNFTCY